MNTDETNTNEINADECDFIKFLNNELKIGESRVYAKKMDSSISNDAKLSLCNVDMYIKTSCYTEAINIIKSLIREKCNREIIPLLYRKVIFYIAYCIYIDKHEYNMIAIYKDRNNEIKIKNQSDILKILNLHKDSFKKWGMESPFYIYKVGNDLGIKIDLYRNGKKNGELCYIINQLIDQAKPSILAEGFCGLGAVTVSRKYRKMTIYLNDGDPTVANFLKQVKETPTKLKNECKSILEQISKMNKSNKEIINEILKSNSKELYTRAEVEKIIEQCIEKRKIYNLVISAKQVYQEKNLLIRVFVTSCNLIRNLKNNYKKLNNIEKYLNEIRKINIAECEQVVKLVIDILKELLKLLENKCFKPTQNLIKKFIKEIRAINIEKGKIVAEVVIEALKNIDNPEDNFMIPEDECLELAGAFYFVHSFQFKGRDSASGITETSLKEYKNNLNSLYDYSKALKNVKEIYSKDILNFIDILEEDKTLLYLDPPYPGTRGYDVKLKKYDDFFEKVSKFRGKCILSFRTKTNKATKEKKPDCLLRYFRSMRDHISTNLYVLLTNNSQEEIMITNFDFDITTIDRGTFYCISKFSNKFKKANTYEKISFEDFLKKLEYKN